MAGQSDGLRGVTMKLILSALIFLLGGCAAGRGDFALIGDMPYDARQEKEFDNLMADIDAAELAFVVHDGDFWWDGGAWTEQAGGMPPCSDAAFADRLARAQRSRHPFIYVAGDNEWADCHRAKPRTYDPVERLAKLRQMFFQGDVSLGQRRMKLTRQSENSRYASFRENVRWTYGDVVFLTLHMIGSNNNLGRTAQMDAEYEERNAANLAWMRESFDLATRGGSRAVMIIAQADPYFQNTWPTYMQERYALWAIGVKPPSSRRTTGYEPVMKLEASEARNRAAAAISSGIPNLPNRCLGPMTSRAFSIVPKRSGMRSVSTAPGESVLTRIFCAAWSTAIALAMVMSAPLVEQ